MLPARLAHGLRRIVAGKRTSMATLRELLIGGYLDGTKPTPKGRRLLTAHPDLGRAAALNEERSCFTCAHSPYPRPGCDALRMDEDIDQPIIDYCEASGANTDLGNGFPTDRTIACPGWQAREGA